MSNYKINYIYFNDKLYPVYLFFKDYNKYITQNLHNIVKGIILFIPNFLIPTIFRFIKKLIKN